MRHFQQLRRVVALMALLCAACRDSDPPVPWDVAEMMRQLSADLRRFEGVTSEARAVEVLAWLAREQIHDRGASLGVSILRRDRSEGALVWGRFETKEGRSEWLVMEAFRRDRDGWTRAFFNTDFSVPPAQLRPGQSADGTWHGFNRYPKPPTSAEICEFARVNFLYVDPARRDNGCRTERTVALRRRTWRHVTGEEPVCMGWDQ